MEQAAPWGGCFPLIPSGSVATPRALLHSQLVAHLTGLRSRCSGGRALEAGFFAKSGFVSRRTCGSRLLKEGPFPLVPSLCSKKIQGVSKKRTFLLIFFLYRLYSGGQDTVPAAWARCFPPL